jgi:hypothetical protein
MAKRRATAVETVSPPVMPLIEMGKKVGVKVKSSSTEEIVYTLSDGTKLHLRPILANVERSLEKFNPTGDPLYQVAAALLIHTVVPKKLKRKA